MDSYTILLSLGIGVIGYFLRDIYNFIKRKFVKGSPPKTSLNYEFRHSSTSGTNPRRYTFKSELIFKNIDTLPIYEVEVFLIMGNNKEKIKKSDYLVPNADIRILQERVVNYKNEGNDPLEAQKLISEDFKNPQIVVTFENKEGHRFKKIKEV